MGRSTQGVGVGKAKRPSKCFVVTRWLIITLICPGFHPKVSYSRLFWLALTPFYKVIEAPDLKPEVNIYLIVRESTLNILKKRKENAPTYTRT